MNSKKPRRIRSQRAVSNVFAIFNDSQIQEFKEVFNMIDQNRDGVIDQNDLQEIFSSLGKETTDVFLNDMIGEAPGPINFTTFLTLFGTKMSGTDPEDVIRNAFQSFDYNNTGKLSEETVREILMRSGGRFTDNEVDDLLRDAPIKDGMLDYVEFCRLLKHGKKEETNS